MQTKVRQFTYSQLKIMTGKFKHVIGGGGFGSVYCGRLEDRSRVAVKMRSQRSSQGLKHFLAEVSCLDLPQVAYKLFTTPFSSNLSF